MCVALLMEFAGLRILVDGGFLKGFDPQQIQSLAMLMFKLHACGYTIAMVFFGFGLLVSGYLIFRSSYFPRALGVLLMFAGSGYLIDCFARFLAPQVAAVLFPWALLPGFLAELGLCAWLLVKGANVPKWEEKARAA